MHKIIVGTPRSGTSFVTKWYANEYPQCTPMNEKRLFEHFEPDYADWPDLGDVEGIDKETQKRINEFLKQKNDKLIYQKKLIKSEIVLHLNALIVRAKKGRNCTYR